MLYIDVYIIYFCYSYKLVIGVKCKFYLVWMEELSCYYKTSKWKCLWLAIGFLSVVFSLKTTKSNVFLSLKVMFRKQEIIDKKINLILIKNLIFKVSN